uniref:Bromodomain testis associated n=1 Tax=Molossus molossus TaxID=27622 RepID=A0A7J8F6Y0_MOLMO|nr:bromodomain testis associated [Molossus molossus]
MFLKCILQRSQMNLLRVCLCVTSKQILQKPLVEKAVVKLPPKITLLVILKMNKFSVLQSFRSRFCLKYLSIS